MQQQGGRQWSRLNPYAEEFFPLHPALYSRDGVQRSDSRQQSSGLQSASEARTGRDADLNSHYVSHYVPPPVVDKELASSPTESLYNRLHDFYSSRPNYQHLENISKLCTEHRMNGLLTSGMKDFFQEIFSYLSWTSKPLAESDASYIGAAAETRYGSSSNDLDRTHPPSMHLKLVIVHFAGAMRRGGIFPDNLRILCQDGTVNANRDVLVMNSGYFYQKCLWNSDIVKLPFCTHHEMTNVITLLAKGRVVVLKKRVQALLRLIGLLQIRGVFPSEECEMDENEERYFSEVFSSASILECTSPYSAQASTPVNTIPGLPEQVRCTECKIVYNKAMFLPHYEEYHSVLPIQMSCCSFFFRTKYEYVCHRKAACTETRTETDCGNISVIRHHEQSGISVNLSAVRPFINTHSTPIDDRV